MTYIRGGVVRSSLHIGIPSELVEELEEFSIRSTMKIKCGMGYDPNDCRLTLIARELGCVSKVKMIVT